MDVSDKLASERNGIEDAEPILRANCEAILILIESNVANVLLRLSLAHCHLSFSLY